MSSGVRGINDRQRFLDVNEEPDKPLPPLPMPVTTGKGIQSLHECVKPILNLNLIEDLSSKVAKSLEKCKFPKDGLTQDQSAALYLYSLQCSFYTKFNGALRDVDRTKAVPFYAYYQLFMLALNRLPSVQDHVWRGVTADLSAKYSKDSIHIWHAASSCTDEVSVTDTFLDKKKHRTLFNIKCYNGKQITNHSRYTEESETILPPGTCIRVKSQSNPADLLHIISCEEIMLTVEEMNKLLAAEGVAALPAPMPIITPVLYLLWVDSNVNKSKENLATQQELRVLFKDDFQTFDNLEECELSINQKNNDHIFLIASGRFGQKIVRTIHDLPQLTSVFLYCMDKETNEKWAKHYPKVKAVLTRSNELIKEIEQEKVSLPSDSVDSNQTQSIVKTPFSGYEKQPLMSLEEALKPIDHLIEDLQKWASIAKKQCQYPGNHGLTRDESASIYIYTMETGDTSLYRILNFTLRSENRHEIKIWFPYLKLFMTALKKLPSFQGVVWRGMQMDLSATYTKGQRAIWWGGNSVVADGSVVGNFLSQSGQRTVFTIECINGKSIRDYSCYTHEEEVLLMPGFTFEVKSIIKVASDMHIINIKEIDSSW